MREEAVLLRFGQKVQSVRLSQNLSQEKLAEKSELDRTYISSVERGQRNISILNIVKIAEALQVSPASILDGLGGCNE